VVTNIFDSANHPVDPRESRMPHTTVLARLHVAHAAILDAHHHVTELASCDLRAVADKLKATAEALRDAEEMLEQASR
jgi:hypothetical protein